MAASMRTPEAAKGCSSSHLRPKRPAWSPAARSAGSCGGGGGCSTCGLGLDLFSGSGGMGTLSLGGVGSKATQPTRSKATSTQACTSLPSDLDVAGSVLRALWIRVEAHDHAGGNTQVAEHQRHGHGVLLVVAEHLLGRVSMLRIRAAALWPGTLGKLSVGDQSVTERAASFGSEPQSAGPWSMAVGASPAEISLACEAHNGRDLGGPPAGVIFAKSYCVNWPCSSVTGIGDLDRVVESPLARPLVVTAVSVPALK
jgi:hypothetical protein